MSGEIFSEIAGALRWIYQGVVSKTSKNPEIRTQEGAIYKVDRKAFTPAIQKTTIPEGTRIAEDFIGNPAYPLVCVGKGPGGHPKFEVYKIDLDDTLPIRKVSGVEITTSYRASGIPADAGLTYTEPEKDFLRNTSAKLLAYIGNDADEASKPSGMKVYI